MKGVKEMPEVLVVAQTQDAHESFLGHLDASDSAHTLLPLFLFLEELFLSRNITAVALCRHIFAVGANSLARKMCIRDRYIGKRQKMTST